MERPDSSESREATRQRDSSTRLYFGDVHFSEQSIEEVRFSNRRVRNLGIRDASVDVVPSEKLRWDYRAETKLYGRGSLLLTGVCVKATHTTRDGMNLKLRGPFWLLERADVQSFETFGMSNRENMYWLVKLSNTRVAPFPGMDLDTELRPFLYAIPLKGLSSTRANSLVMGDSGIVSHEYDTTFEPLLKQLESTKSQEFWHDTNPKVWGVVLARNMIEAEDVALSRARFTADLVNFALRTGISHFETRYEDELLSWDGEARMTSVSLHPWILLREANALKGWVRQIPTTSLQSEPNLDDCMERIEFFADRFLDAHQAGNVHTQLGKEEMSNREHDLSVGIQRSLRWLSIASEENDIRDQFISTWIALEAILDSIQYPGVFDGDRKDLKDALLEGIRSIDVPKATNDLLDVTTQMIENRILEARWPTRRKLAIFARAFGTDLQPNHMEIVRELAGTRAKIFHAGEDEPTLSNVQLEQLRYLVERLVVAASIGAYQDLEDRHHQIHFGEISPKGGFAPMFVDGREVLYDLHVVRGEDGQQRGEWLSEGKIYTQEDL